VHGADILVLDEATSSIDTETEALVQRGIHVLLEGRTAIAIAHRLSTIRDMDRIHVLDGGRLVESGSHEELVAARGVYHRLYRLQQDSRSETAQALASA
jgi:ATP-binding cassette subfamily B protein